MIRLKKEKPKNGKLIQVFPSGKTIILASNKPFSVLQQLKKSYIQKGYKADTLKVTYLNADKKKAPVPATGILFNDRN